ncbi:hypothetical protein GEMRC1_004084 [Eukaryota sp. GEM-RC1]
MNDSFSSSDVFTSISSCLRAATSKAAVCSVMKRLTVYRPQSVLELFEILKICKSLKPACVMLNGFESLNLEMSNSSSLLPPKMVLLNHFVVMLNKFATLTGASVWINSTIFKISDMENFKSLTLFEPFATCRFSLSWAETLDHLVFSILKSPVEVAKYFKVIASNGKFLNFEEADNPDFLIDDTMSFGTLDSYFSRFKFQ